MFHGTQHVPKQIVESFIRETTIVQLSKACIDEKSNPSVVSLYKKLTGEKSGNEVIISEGVCGVGKERPVQLTASQVVAVEHLLGLTISKQCGIIYSRFVANHQLYSSVDYVRSKRHVNCNVSFEQDRLMYGSIIGLLSIKPECLCDLVELQYCTLYSIVLVQPMAVSMAVAVRKPQ